MSAKGSDLQSCKPQERCVPRSAGVRKADPEGGWRIREGADSKALKAELSI